MCTLVIDSERQAGECPGKTGARQTTEASPTEKYKRGSGYCLCRGQRRIVQQRLLTYSRVFQTAVILSACLRFAPPFFSTHSIIYLIFVFKITKKKKKTQQPQPPTEKSILKFMGLIGQFKFFLISVIINAGRLKRKLFTHLPLGPLQRPLRCPLIGIQSP